MYEKLYAANTGLMWYWVNRYANACRMRPEIDADDLYQSAFLALVEAEKSYAPDRDTWGTWASFYIRKALRECVGLRGRKQVETVSIDTRLSEDGETTIGDMIQDESLLPSDAQILADETALAVRSAIDSIKSEKVRLAIRFVYLDGNSHAVAAQRIGCKPGQVAGLLSSGRIAMHRNAKLRQALDIDNETRFHAHKGVRGFNITGTSVVEDAVIWREKQNDKRRF